MDFNTAMRMFHIALASQSVLSLHMIRLRKACLGMTQKRSKFSPRAWSPQDPSLAPRLHKLGKMIFGTTTPTLSELSFQLVKLLPGGPLEYKAFTSTWRSSWAPVRRHAIYYREPHSNGFVEKSSKFWRFLQKKLSSNFATSTPTRYQHSSR